MDKKPARAPPCCKVPNKLLNAGAGTQIKVIKLCKELQTTIIMATKDILESRIKFKEIYEYDMKSKQLFKNDEEVQMPKNEAKLFFLLVSNIEKIVSYEVIENYVSGEKSMSNEALRMTIKKIRAKTDTDLIKNISGVGYKLSGASLNLTLCSFYKFKLHKFLPFIHTFAKLAGSFIKCVRLCFIAT